MTVTFDSGKQMVALNPSLNDPVPTRAAIESMRTWFANNGFTDLVPWLEVGWSWPTLDPSVTAPINMLYQYFTDWPSIYSALGLDPPTN